MRAHEFLTELGNNPYKAPKKWSSDYDSNGFVPRSKKITTANGILRIDINQFDTNAIVNFYVNDGQLLSGGGDAFRILSTVIHQIKDYVRKIKPDYIVFGANTKEQSRISLYDRIVPRLAADMGYEDVTDDQVMWNDDVETDLDELGNMGDQKIYVMMNANEFMIEAPLADYVPLGDFDKPGPFRGPDKKLAVHPVNISKAERFFENNPYDFRLFVSNISGTGKYAETGVVDEQQLTQMFGAENAKKIMANSENAITVVYVGNAGDAKRIFTPWIMAHRFGHAIQASTLRGRNNSGMMTAWKNAEEHFFSTVNTMLAQTYGQPASRRQSGMDWSMTQKYNALFNAIGTQRSSRSKEIRRPYEFFYEMFAQYLGTGHVKLNPFPKQLGYGRQAWGNPTQFLTARGEHSNPEFLADEGELLGSDLEMLFDDVVSNCVGKIFVM